MTRHLRAWCRQVARRGLAQVLPRRVYLTHGPARSGAVCLTFDDGPHPEVTPRLLDLLRELGVPGTFFLVGREAERCPELVRRTAAEGHAIGSHTYSHALRATLSRRQAAAEVANGAAAIGRILGRPPTLYRPPGGKVTVGDMWRLWRAGMTNVLWNVDPKDCTAPRTAADVEQWFQNRPLAGGDIGLFHDDQPKILDVLPRLVATARDRNLTFTTIEAWAK
jgi:peptidoglycan-N-acetylglucosamine deacetylase